MRNPTNWTRTYFRYREPTGRWRPALNVQLRLSAQVTQRAKGNEIHRANNAETPAAEIRSCINPPSTTKPIEPTIPKRRSSGPRCNIRRMLNKDPAWRDPRPMERYARRFVPLRAEADFPRFASSTRIPILWATARNGSLPWLVFLGLALQVKYEQRLSS